MKVKKIIGLLAAVTLVTGLTVGMGTKAFFTSSASSQNNSFNAGTLILGGKDATGAETPNKFMSLDIENLEPGASTGPVTTTIRNIGSLPIKLYRITSSNIVADNPTLDQVVTVNITIDGEHVYTGKLSDLRAANGGYFDPITPVASESDHQLAVTATMSKGADDKYQGKKLTCDLTLYGTQTNFPENGGNLSPAQYNLGTAVDSNGSPSSPTFSVAGYNTASQVCFDWDWDPNDLLREYYEIRIKHETGNVTTDAIESRIIIKFDEKVISTDGIDNSDVSVDWNNDIVRINRNAFPSDWQGFEVELSGVQKLTSATKTIPWQYWSLDK